MTELLNRRPDFRKDKLRAAEEMPETFRELKDIVENSFESQEEGLDTQAVTNFIDRLGLQVSSSLIFLDPSELPRLQKIHAEYGMRLDYHLKKKPAFYLGQIDSTIVLRDLDTEKQNSPILTEGFAVHELAHASSRHRTFLIEDGETEHAVMPRTGLAFNTAEKSRGGFLEEGFCDLIRGRYLEERMSEDRVKEWVTSFGLPIGTSLDTDLTLEVNIDDKPFGDIPLAAKFLYHLDNGEIGSTTPAYAGYAMELLVRHDPQLLAALIAARSDVSGLREVAQRIEAVQKGLYSKLRRIPYDQKQFAEGLLDVYAVLKSQSSKPVQ